MCRPGAARTNPPAQSWARGASALETAGIRVKARGTPGPGQPLARDRSRRRAITQQNDARRDAGGGGYAYPGPGPVFGRRRFVPAGRWLSAASSILLCLSYLLG